MGETAKKAAGRPVVVFIYGGSWGNGDKSMYGLLASQLSDRLSAVVVCPNYSIYPKVLSQSVRKGSVPLFALIFEHFNFFGYAAWHINVGLISEVNRHRARLA